MEAGLVCEIYCDDRAVASVRNGKKAVFEIDDDAHSIQCIVKLPNRGYYTVNNDQYGRSWGTYGRTEPMVSDIVYIPHGTQSAELFVKRGAFTLKLELLRLF